MWYNHPVVRALLKYMQSKGCKIDELINGQKETIGFVFEFEGKEQKIYGEDLETAIYYAERIEWEPEAIRRRFEQYLIGIYKKRQENGEIS